VLRSPEIHIDSVKYSEEWKSPRDPINDYTFSLREELIDDSTKEEDMDERPDEECPGSRSNISLFAVIINTLWCSDGINVGPEEDKVNNNVDDFQKNSIFPGVSHGCSRKVSGNGATML